MASSSKGKGKERRVECASTRPDVAPITTLFQQLAWAGLLRKIWPAERALLGLRVDKWMHKELLGHVDEILIVCRNNLKKLREGRVEKDLSRFHRNRLQIDWTSHSAVRASSAFLGGLAAAAATGKFGPGLIHMELTGIDLRTATHLAEVLLVTPALKHLDLSNVRGIFSAETAEMMGHALQECRALTHLDLSGTRIEGYGAQRLGEALSGCKHLVHLNLGNACLGATELGHLASTVRNSTLLSTLSLRQNRFTSSTEAVSEWLSALPCLTHLDMGGNYLQQGALALARGLTRCTCLTRLDLSNCSVEAGGAKAFGPVLKACSRLQQLHLHGNDLGDEGASALAQALPDCATLRRLDLAKNFIDPAGGAQIAQALPALPALTELDLRMNSVAGEGARRLMEVLAVCSSLVLLDLTHNRIEGPAAQALQTLAPPRCRAFVHPQ